MKMPGGRWAEIEPIFDRALELDGPQRSDFLALACAADQALRADVEALLAADSAADDRLTAGMSINADAWPSPLGTEVGPYRLLKTIGEGGMGRVFLAERIDGEFSQQVAIKFLSLGIDPRAQQRFQSECQNLARLDHPNIVHLLDAGVAENGASYLVMQYVEGVSIDRYAAGKRAELGVRLGLFGQLCDAVQAAHRNLIVHRDLKPSNVLVTDGGEVKLLDFGISRDLSDDSTATSSLLTPRFAAPEQILGQPVTTATDLYGLGTILHALLTGLPPFADQDTSIEALAARARQSEPPRPSSLPVSPPITQRQLRGDLDAITLKCLQADPAGRYESAGALRDDVEAFLAGREISARRVSSAIRVWRFVNRHRWASAAAAAVLATAIGSGSYHLRTVQVQRDSAVATTTFLIDLMQDINPYNSSSDGALEVPLARLYEIGVQRLDDSGIPNSEKSRLALSFSEGLSAVDDHQTGLLAAEKAVSNAAADAPESPLHYAAVTRRAAAYTNLNEYQPAWDDYLWLTRRIGASIPADSLQAALIWNEYGALLRAQGKPGEAESMFALAQQAAQHRVEEPQAQELLLTILANRSFTLSGLGREALAWELAQQQIALSLARFGEDHIRTAEAYGNAATLSTDPQAELEMAEKAFATARRVLGPDHSETLAMQNNYALQLSHLGRQQEAIPILEDMIETLEASVRHDPQAIATGHQNLAAMFRATLQLDAATEHAGAAYANYETVLPQGHWRLALPYLTLSEIALKKGQPQQALAYAQKARERLGQLPPEHYIVLTAHALAAISKVALGHCVEPELLLDEAEIKALWDTLGDRPYAEHLPRLAQVEACR